MSCTGQGEVFIRQIAAYDIAALIEYRGLSVQAAMNEVISKKLTEAGGEGGAIALDRLGNFAMSYNTEGMFRGFVTDDGQCETLIFDT